MTVYEADDRVEDLHRAIGVYEAALGAPASSEQAAGCAANLVGALRARYERSGDLADIDRAVTLGREAVGATRDPIERPLRQNTLAAALLERHSALGRDADLDLAIELLEQAIGATPLTSPSRPGIANNLGNARRTRYDNTGERGELEQAIALLEEAVERAHDDARSRVSWLANLGGALNARYDATGDLADLERAIATCETALNVPAHGPDRAGCLSDLANGLVALFERSGGSAQLDRAIDCYREASGIATARREHSISLSNLGLALQVRYQHAGREGDLRDAVAAYEESYRALPDSDQLHWRVLGNLSGALQLLAALTSNAEFLARALAGYEATVEHIDERSPDAPVAWSNLALGLQSRYDSDRAPADLVRSVELYRRSCEEGVAVRPGMFVGVAQRWGEWAVGREQWQEAADAFDAALDGLDEVVRSQVAREHKESWLRDAVGVSGDAAAAAVRAGQRERATAALERGRAVLLSDALSRDGAALDELAHRGLGALADRFRAAADRLTALERRSEGRHRGQAHGDYPALI
jgi:tetratricopeptide (TPR) repeat protein